MRFVIRPGSDPTARADATLLLALGLPGGHASKIALRTQQVILEESGVPDTIDPLGGSYLIEALTDRIEEEATSLIAEIDGMGGMINAIEEGFPQREIGRAAY